MKLSLMAITSLLLGTSAIAQDSVPRIQDQFHAIIAVPCSEKSNFYTDIASNMYTEQILFNSIAINTILSPQGVEYSMSSVIGILVNQDTGTFSVIMVFEDGVSCLLTDGNNFTPY